MITISEHPVTVKTPATEQILETALSLGYEAIFDPYKPSRVVRWFRGRDFRPDILVKNGNREAIVVAMSGLASFTLVHFTHLERRKGDTGALICVSDSAFPNLPKSTRDYANDLNVRLCPLSEVGDALKELLD
jgi:hypothetical protein